MASLVVSLGQIPPDNSKQQKSALNTSSLFANEQSDSDPEYAQSLRSTYEKAEQEK